MIKVLVVDDSTFLRKIIKQILSFDPEIEVIDEAGDGKEAIEKTLLLGPDVITMDIIMPGFDGLWALEEIMKQRPTPVILVSSISLPSSDVVQEAFSLGVVDVVIKPEKQEDTSAIRKELIEKVRAASKINKVRLLENKALQLNKKKPLTNSKATQVVVIATSAGGPPSLYEVISKFSENLSAGIIIAQHLPSVFVDSFIAHLQTKTTLHVRHANKGDILRSRDILFSPTDSTLELYNTKRGKVVNLIDYQVRLQPDIDKVIISCAKAFRFETILVILSGLGNSGVKGAEEVKKLGGKVIVEDESTAGVFNGMPLSVITSGFYDTTSSSYTIAATVERYLGSKVDAAGQKNFYVKGSVLKNTMNYLQEKEREKVCSDILANMTENSRNTLSGEINSYNYFPGSIYNELNENIFKFLSKANPNIIETIAYENARNCYRLFKKGLDIVPLDVENLITVLETINKIIFPEVQWEKVSLNLEKKYLKFIQRNGGYTESNSEILANATNSWTLYFFEQAKLTLTRIENETGKDNKGYFIACSVWWK
ncbi:MAG: response regulator [Elusimicrobia bacterium]|nr:response regulator [Candidatus Liberimonas magnetica]